MVTHWLISGSLILIGLGVGVALAISSPTIYTAQARLAVGGTNLSATAIPGFAAASNNLASDYARYVSSSEANQTLATQLGSAASEVTGVSASAVADSNVLFIETTSRTRPIAVKAATVVASNLMATVNGSASRPSELLTQYGQLSAQVTAANDAVIGAQGAVVRSPSSGNKAALQQAVERLSVLTLRKDAASNAYLATVGDNSVSAHLIAIGSAGITSNNRAAKFERYGLIGLACGFVVALVATNLVGRRRKHASTY